MKSNFNQCWLEYLHGHQSSNIKGKVQNVQFTSIVSLGNRYSTAQKEIYRTLTEFQGIIHSNRASKLS